MKSRGNFQNFDEGESQNSKNSTCQKGENSGNRNGGQGNFRDINTRGIGRGTSDKSNVQCFNCQRFSHFASECKENKNET